ncbi:MAG: hypothetical protein QXW50_05020 [Nitrososphaerota archaeon]
MQAIKLFVVSGVYYDDQLFFLRYSGLNTCGELSPADSPREYCYDNGSPHLLR